MTEPAPWDAFCSLERLLALHARGIREHGGRPGVREAECPEATLGAAWSADEYSRPPEAQPGFLFSVYLLYYFTTKQCFNDGNKRVAWASMSEALARLDLEIDATDEEAEAFVLDIAERRINSIATVAAWVTARLRELSPRSEGLASPTRYRRVVDLD